MTDANNDVNVGVDEKWYGHFFMPVIGREYQIPLNAGNYMSLRGKIGKCVDIIGSKGGGHVWAVLIFELVDGAKSTRRAIRTNYLIDAETKQQGPRIRFDDEDDSQAALNKGTAVWNDEFQGNSGVSTITQQQ